MTSKKKSAAQGEEKGKAKAGKLKLNRESVRDLSPGGQSGIKGGVTPNKTKATCGESGCAQCP